MKGISAVRPQARSCAKVWSMRFMGRVGGRAAMAIGGAAAVVRGGR
jgi:hypothetical protein